MHDFLIFGMLPYVALTLFLVGTIYRYRQRSFTYSSLSSQFLENEHHFWGSVPFHYGIIVVLAGHVLAFLMPGVILAWNAAPLRLFLLEVTGLGFAVLTLFGLVNILWRRWHNKKARIITSASDWVLNALLATQVITGIVVATRHGWGSSWFATSIAPWLWSLFKLNPEVAYVSALPVMVKLHVLNAWLLIGLFPFTRLVHVLVVPNPYLWRKTQVVLWNWDRSGAKQSGR